MSSQQVRVEFLRHAVATLAYRGRKVLDQAPPEFGELGVGDQGTRSPLEILCHIGDLLAWAVSMAQGREAWTEGPAEDWPGQVDRFFGGLEELDAVLSSGELACSPERLFQGPVADALTHVGQLGMLRRVAGSPVRGENYFRAEISAGRLGRDQAEPKREFD